MPCGRMIWYNEAMKDIREIVRDIIDQRILPRIERDGISKLILPEQITPDDCIRPARGEQACDKHFQHREHELGIGLTGKVPYCIDNKVFVFTPGRMVLLPGRTPHTAFGTALWRTKSLDLDQPSSTIWLKVYPAGVWSQVIRLVGEKENETEATQPYMFVGHRFDSLISNLLEEVRSRQPNYERVGRAILLEFMERCLRATFVASAVDRPRLPRYRRPAKSRPKHPPGMVRAAREFIHFNYHTPIGLDDIAEAADVGADRLGREFKATLGVTSIQYLLNVRMEAARELLATDLKISEVARMVGIKDYHYFSRLFHRINGLSPIQYRRQRIKSAIPALPLR